MDSFLRQIACQTLDFSPESTLFIFPTQRACQEFRKEYIRIRGGFGMLPGIISIRDLLTRLDAPPVADDITLLLELHRCHCSLFDKVEMDDFLAYGQQVLDDFNEIDRQLIDATTIFRQINNQKSLEDQFRHDTEEYEFLKNFWTEFFAGKVIAGLRESFLKYWSQLPALYEAFRKRLAEKNMAYEGMAWRHVAENIASQTYFDRKDNVIPAGFYALNEAEALIFEHLKKQSKLRLFRDADVLYTNNQQHEAGIFFRRGILSDSEIPWNGSHFEQPKDSYLVKGCNGRYAIARELANDLSAALKENPAESSDDTVVVFSDESLLFPFLHHCALLNIPLNPSMGFPVKHHPLMRIIHQLKKARKTNLHESGEGIQFRFLEDFCSDPLIRDCFPFEENGTGNGQPLFNVFLREALLSPPRDSSTEKEKLLGLLGRFHFSESDWISHLHTAFLNAVKRICNLLELHEEVLPVNTWWKLLIQHLEAERVPFSTGNDGGIAVMGFLETRLLDFRNVIIAPLNEGVLPTDTASSSLIPYAIRKAFHLPCKEEQQAITAYHFYRLLQRASNITLYYNTDLNDTGGGERSRYLLQLHHELILSKKPKRLNYLQQVSKIEPETMTPLVVKKTMEIIELMQERFCIGEDGSVSRGFSASALNSYIACSLRFYLDHVVYLRPKDKAVGLSAGEFGNVLHKAMEHIYDGTRETTQDLFENLHPRVESIVDLAIREAYGKPADSGHDYLMKDVLVHLVRRILRFDEKNSPFRVIGLESKLTSSLETTRAGRLVGLKGTIDRIDSHGREWRVLDYKTGQEKPLDVESMENIFNDSAYKLNLQLFLYALLVHDNFKDEHQPLKTGIFHLRSSGEGITWLNEGNPVNISQLQEFRTGLAALVDEIFNTDKDFVQTEDLDKCRYCSYQGLCNRRTK